MVALSSVVVTMACATSPVELPPVAAVLTAPSDCRPEQHGREAIPIVNAGDGIDECATLAAGQGCVGAVEFEVEVDEIGRAEVVTWNGTARPALRACVEAAVRESALGPASDCRGALVKSRTHGSLTWNLATFGTGVGLANVSGLIDGLSLACVAESGRAIRPMSRDADVRPSRTTGTP